MPTGEDESVTPVSTYAPDNVRHMPFIKPSASSAIHVAKAAELHCRKAVDEHVAALGPMPPLELQMCSMQGFYT